MNDLVLNAMRLAEYAHRTHYKDPVGQFRKAPDGEDRPAYFLHLSEVAWMLNEAGCAAETIAAGYLHDVIEDCEGWDKERLANEIGSDAVVDLVDWVTEPGKDQMNNAGREAPWEERNRAYIQRLADAPDAALAISCADKTSNLRDMVRLTDKGHTLDAFLSRGHAQQLKKFTELDALFAGRVPETLLRRYREAFGRFQAIEAA